MTDKQEWTKFLNEMQIYYYVTDNEIQIPQPAYMVPPGITEGGDTEIYTSTGVLHLQFTSSGSYMGSIFTINNNGGIIRTEE